MASVGPGSLPGGGEAQQGSEEHVAFGRTGDGGVALRTPVGLSYQVYPGGVTVHNFSLRVFNIAFIPVTVSSTHDTHTESSGMLLISGPRVCTSYSLGVKRHPGQGL